MERHQIALYLAALALAAMLGVLVPTVASPAELAIEPILGLLLYVTFLGVPFAQVGRALRDWQFLTTVLILNFMIVPVVVWLLSRIVAHDQALLVGVLFVLLTPCVDYVIVFTGLAGGARDRLLAAAPLLMLAQMVLLPVYLLVFVGQEFVSGVELRPFVHAFAVLIVLPLIAAVATQVLARHTRLGAAFERAAMTTMTPLMMLTLAAVVASQIAGVTRQAASLLLAIVVFALFAIFMVPVGMLTARAAALNIPGQRAVVFSGVTRNSLVVLPLVLALPAAFSLAPLVVVTQTLVELVVMVVLVRLLPRLIREQRPS